MPRGSSVSGHTLVQPLASVQVIFPPCSELSRYMVRPSPLTRTVPSPATSVTLRVTDSFDDSGTVGPTAEVLCLDGLPHAIRSAVAPSANHTRRGWCLKERALILGAPSGCREGPEASVAIFHPFTSGRAAGIDFPQPVCPGDQAKAP